MKQVSTKYEASMETVSGKYALSITHVSGKPPAYYPQEYLRQFSGINQAVVMYGIAIAIRSNLRNPSPGLPRNRRGERGRGEARRGSCPHEPYNKINP